MPGGRAMRSPAGQPCGRNPRHFTEDLAYVADGDQLAFSGFMIPGRISAPRSEVEGISVLNGKVQHALSLFVRHLFPQRVMVMLIPDRKHSKLAAVAKNVGKRFTDGP